MPKNSKETLKNMSVAELKTHAEMTRQAIFALRLRKMSAPVKDVFASKKLKKELARTLTLLNQKELNGN